MIRLIAVAFSLLLGSAQAQTLQGRDFNGDGTADGYYDTVQNITWLADANYYATIGGVPGTTYFGSTMRPGEMSFMDSLSWVAGLNVDGVAGWRLPERITPSGGSSPYCSATACDVRGPWPSELSNLDSFLVGTAGPFINIQSGEYMAISPSRQLHLELRSLQTDFSLLTDETGIAWGYVLPVHNGDVGRATPVTPVPEPSTYVLLLLGLLALTGSRLRRSPGRLAVG